MTIALTVIHVIMCFAIIGIVLLQAGKGADIGSAFGGAGSQAVFGSMGTPTILGKVTTVVAIIFTITSFSLALLGGEDGLRFYRLLAGEGRRRLRPNGTLMVELGFGQATVVTEILTQEGWRAEMVKKDLDGIERILIARRLD